MSHENENETLVGKGWGGGGRLICQLSRLTLSSPHAEAKILLLTQHEAGSGQPPHSPNVRS